MPTANRRGTSNGNAAGSAEDVSADDLSRWLADVPTHRMDDEEYMRFTSFRRWVDSERG
jgi:hypothetical protein